MRLKSLEIAGFKSFARKSKLEFESSISAIVGPNGSGKSNVAEAFRFVLGEQSMKSLRGKRGEDLIYSGNQGNSRLNKANVKLVFDNTDRTLELDFDEVVIERSVHRDGVNDYHINGSQVRLKDVTELLSGANIGATGHHIISQGETDRILNASVKDRRDMLEDALGLKVFQYKKTESERKLQKTEDNIAQVQSLRKEIAPHIKFLKKQVERIEKAKELKEQLKVLYREYLKREDTFLKNRGEQIAKELEAPKKELAEVKAKIDEYKKTLETKEENKTGNQELISLEEKIQELKNEENTLNRKIGQLEGEISSLKRLQEEEKRKQQDNQEKVATLEEIKNIGAQIDNAVNQANTVNDPNTLKNILISIKNLYFDFIKTKVGSAPESTSNFEKNISKLEAEKSQIESQISNILEESKNTQNKINEIKQKAQEDQAGMVEAERAIFDFMNKKGELETLVNKLEIEKDSLDREQEEYNREVTEAGVLVGSTVLDFSELKISDQEIMSEDRNEQKDRRRELEKMKIRIEEMGGGSGEDVMKEFNDATERDEFLIKEIEDLEKSSSSLKELIKDLDDQINTKFREGISKINTEFQKFFELMFGGGNASLKVVKTQARKKKDTDIDFNEEDEEEAEEGVDIDVNLPRKKVKGLMMLSGGERALSSIALLFAMSAVNPPPFIILDETDAALDEANSKKYGDMVDNLSEHSQLILITHNRETMSRAGIIYGITMDQGVSQVLSIKFDDGIKYAK
jgi:chromosome segregation protein